jgi:hypothetical protein
VSLFPRPSVKVIGPWTAVGDSVAVVATEGMGLEVVVGMLGTDVLAGRDVWVAAGRLTETSVGEALAAQLLTSKLATRVKQKAK